MKLSCMSQGGIPVQPFVTLGGFIPEGTAGFPENPNYAAADTVVMTLLVDNYDAKNEL